KGRDAYDRKDFPGALKMFDRLLSLVAELEPTKDQGLLDLSTLASGFRDLTKVAIAAKPAAAAPAPSAGRSAEPGASTGPSSAAAAQPAQPDVKVPVRKVFTSADADVKPPVAISQVLPPWHPETVIEKKTTYHGVVDLLIDEYGRVLSAAIVRSLN